MKKQNYDKIKALTARNFKKGLSAESLQPRLKPMEIV